MTDRQQMRLVVGSDSAGARLAGVLLADLRAHARVAEVVALTHDERDLYPEIAIAAAEMVKAGTFDRAVLVCGTGLGMAISANKVPGIRAVTAHDSLSVERSILSNNAQVLCLGERIIGIELARRLVDEWLGYSFDETSASAQKVETVTRYELSTSRGLTTSAAASGSGEE